MPHRVRDWATIRREYEETDEPVSGIRARHGVPQATFYERKRAENWRARQTKRKADPKASQLQRRLARAISRRLDELEAVGAEETRDAAERERDTRSLATLIKLQEKLTGLETAGRERASGPIEWTEEYLDRKREELAQKLFAMLEQVHGAPLPDGP